MFKVIFRSRAFICAPGLGSRRAPGLGQPDHSGTDSQFLLWRAVQQPAAGTISRHTEGEKVLAGRDSAAHRVSSFRAPDYYAAPTISRNSHRDRRKQRRGGGHAHPARLAWTRRKETRNNFPLVYANVYSLIHSNTPSPGHAHAHTRTLESLRCSSPRPRPGRATWPYRPGAASAARQPPPPACFQRGKWDYAPDKCARLENHLNSLFTWCGVAGRRGGGAAPEGGKEHFAL